MSYNKFIRDNGMQLSWLVALIATVGSLYFSEILHYLPCKLCWYQRILMYPLVMILGIASLRRDFYLTIYVLPLTIWGAGISIYHYLMQKTDLIPSASTACGPVPCDVDYINWFGFITIPFLAGTAFILITVLQFLTWRAVRGR